MEFSLLKMDFSKVSDILNLDIKHKTKVEIGFSWFFRFSFAHRYYKESGNLKLRDNCVSKRSLTITCPEEEQK